MDLLRYSAGLNCYNSKTIILYGLGISVVDSSIPSVAIFRKIHIWNRVRTEYLEYSRGFTSQFNSYIDKLWEQVDYYVEMAEQLINNPMLAIDYIAKAYLITGEDTYKEQIKQIALKSISGTNPVIRALTDSDS